MMSVFLFLAISWVVIDVLLDPFYRVQTVTVPNFSGQAVEDVRTEEWMEIITEYRYDKIVEAGSVISQNPSGGSLRKIGRDRPTCRIVLTVSLGEETVTLPNVVGMDVRVAESKLREMGLVVKTEISTGAYPEGEVFAMTPKGNMTVSKGTTVTLSVSAGTPAVTVTVPDVRGLSRGEALMRLWLSQLSVAELIEEESIEEGGTVIRQSYQPGTVVMAGTKLTLYVSKST